MAALGFEILVPSVPLPGAIPYTITGAESQVISFTLKPGKYQFILRERRDVCILFMLL